MEKEVEVIILAGGRGTRLQQVIRDIPKPMAAINDKPFLEYLILRAKASGFKNFRLLTGYKSEIITSFFQDGRNLGVSIKYSHEDVPLGTGGAIKMGINGSEFNQFICLNGDSYFGIDFNSFVNTAESLTLRKDWVGCLALKSLQNSDRYGSVVLSQEGRIEQFLEKKPMSQVMINAGVYFLKRDIVNFIEEGNRSIETEVFPLLSQQKLLFGVPMAGHFIDIGIPEDYYTACQKLQSWIQE